MPGHIRQTIKRKVRDIEMEKSIRDKVSSRILLIGISMFLISLVLLYVLFVPGMRKNAIDRVENANKEVIQQIDSQMSFVQDYTENLALSVAQNPEILRYFSMTGEQNRNRASLLLNSLISYEGVIRCVMISTGDVTPLDSMNEVTEEDWKILDSDWYYRLKNTAFGRGISKVYQVETNSGMRYTAAYLKNFYHANNKYTYVVFVDLNNLIRSFDMMAENTLDYGALVDSEEHIFYEWGEDSWEKDKNVFFDKVNTVQSIGHGIGFTRTSVNYKWKVVSYVADETIFRMMSYYLVGIVFTLGLFMLTTLAVISKSIGNIIRPISQLSKSMNEISKGNLDCKVLITSNDEIGLLSRTFNKMTEELKDSLEVITEKEKEEQRIRFSLLISQIDPHFIYNTINSINYLARRQRYKDVIKVNSALISILQDRLRINDIQFTDSIEKEIKVIEQYVEIERYMYDGNLELIWDVPTDMYQRQIPKNMIQPLVENALFHGLINEDTGELEGEILISIVEEENNIIVKVADNGLGMAAEKLNTIRQELYKPKERGRRIGLSNISQRLYYLNGNSEGIEIKSKLGEGTIITLNFAGEYLKK